MQSGALRYSTVSLIILGAGPPCQGVSGLNSDRRGALCLFKHVSRVKRLCKQKSPWSQVQGLSENVASMDSHD